MPFFTVLALPAPPPFPELVKDANYIARVRIHDVNSKNLNKKTISVSAKAEVLEAYKTPIPMPARLDLAFLVFPDLFGKWLKEAPDEGEYILFLINKPVRDAKGTISNTIVLYEPHPFAIYNYSEELENKVRQTLKP